MLVSVMVKPLPKLALATLCTAIVTLSQAPLAHASWVSHWLGLDHHTSTPTPIPVYVTTPSSLPSPVAITYVVKTTPAAAARPTTRYAPVVAVLPTTGPASDLGLISGILVLGLSAGTYLYWKSNLKNKARHIDIM